MSWFKLIKFFSVSILSLISIQAFASFTDMECLNATFDSTVSHKGQPFGLTNTTLKVTKDKCLLIVEHNEYKYMNNKWQIDVCREPIHIKSGAGAIEVLKKKGNCRAPKSNKEFCKAVKKIESVLQDDGLIFADGEKEDLATDHGRLYCSFLLLKSYLRNDLVYSRHREYSGTLINSNLVNKEENCEIPKKKQDTQSMNNSFGADKVNIETKKENNSQSTNIDSKTINQNIVNPPPTQNGSIPNSSEEGRF